MTKSELLTLIAALPDNADIRIHQPSHDYWRTSLAINPTQFEEAEITHSSYHNCDAVDDSGEEEITTTVFVLR